MESHALISPYLLAIFNLETNRGFESHPLRHFNAENPLKRTLRAFASRIAFAGVGKVGVKKRF